MKVLTYIWAFVASGILVTATADHTPADARVIIKERTKYYSLRGNNGKQLYKSIGKRGPKGTNGRHAIAQTRTKFAVKRIKTGIKGSRCVVKSADVIVDITYLIPRWKAGRKASPQVRAVWKKFQARAIRHEKKHGDINKKFARDVERELLGTRARVARGCKNFGDRAMKRIGRLSKRAARRHKSFDRREAWAISRSARLQRALYRSE